MTSPTDFPTAAMPADVGECGGHDFRVDRKHAQFHTLRAARPFVRGALLIDLTQAETLAEPNYASIDLHDRHVLHPTARYMNHSCNPTAYVDIARKLIVALRDIEAGAEITFNYLSTERQITSPFECNCGAEHCVGKVE